MTLCDDHARGVTPRYQAKQRPRTGCEKCWQTYSQLHPEAATEHKVAATGDQLAVVHEIHSEREAKLQKALEKAMRQRDDLKKRQEGLVEAVYQAAFDAAMLLDIPPVPEPKIPRKKGKKEVAVAPTGDWQLGKVTPDYSTAKCEERIEVYGDKLLRLTEIQRSAHPVEDLHVWLLGDHVEGELIFPGQSHLVDSSLYRQVSVDGPRILLNFLRRMLGHFKQIKVVGVIGNHGALGGRARRDYNPESNADRMLYQNVRNILEIGAGEKRITWDIPQERNERSWYAIDNIGGYKTLLIHGDQLKWGPRAPSTMQKILSWKAGGIPEGFDDVMLGHWHQIQRLRLTNTTVRINGSTESYNTYAQEFLANMDDPSQWVLFVQPGRGVTAEYQVYLT